MNTRTQAYAREAQEIEASQSRAIAAREAESRPRNALEAMANRLQVSPAGLKSTLMQTVFSGCRNDSEFIALVMVANEYHLNPLLKEIYAFPAKGGGIVPMVGYDGWVKLMNNHPQFDGIEYNDHLDSKGNLYAIECIIYRKDRRHPIKLMELLDECRRGTEPWKMMPSRMLRNRVTCQAARLAFGFSGIASEGDEDTFIDGGALAAQSLPPRQSFADQLDDEIPALTSRPARCSRRTPPAARSRTRKPPARWMLGMTALCRMRTRPLPKGLRTTSAARDSPTISLSGSTSWRKSAPV